FDQEATAGLSGLLTNPLKQIAHVRKGNLTVRRSAQDTRFAVQVDIPARGRIKVHFEVVRAIRVPGNFVLIATAPADGITIITNIDGFNLDVAALHPDREALHNTQHGKWQFDAGILPWQGFRFISNA
ncbi:MAG TPA: hypothetical protein VGY99_27555, partial [Candidatus Binataceae bacterium]|nr:hypothetical protein [Candidatus Binataceae bacterium]